MNLAQAVAVCLYELARGGKAAPARAAKSREFELATSGEAERLGELLLSLLRTSGYIKPRATASAEEKMRRLIRRLSLTSADATVIAGMLRQIQWKIESAAPEKS